MQIHGNLKFELRAFLIEASAYSVLVVGYFYAVLRYLGDWLQHLFFAQRVTYAIVALLLIVVQGAVLEMLTRILIRWIKPRRRGSTEAPHP